MGCAVEDDEPEELVERLVDNAFNLISVLFSLLSAVGEGRTKLQVFVSIHASLHIGKLDLVHDG